jgi:outer membrane protein OmpA-like peptidoglycan-associated protein
MKKLYLYFLVIILNYNVLLSLITASDTFLLGNKYAVSAYYDYNMHSVDMRQLSSVADSVPRSALGNMSGFSVGGFYEYRITDRTSLVLRGLFSQQKAKIQGETPETLKYNSKDTLGWSEHTLTTDLSNIRIEPMIKYRFFNRFSLYGGLSAGIRFDKSFTNDEIIKSPLGATFKSGLNTRSGIDTEKEDKLGLQAAIQVGFSYDIPLNYNGKYLLIPEIMFSTGFSDITNTITWDANSFKLGFSLMYSENPTIYKDSRELRERKEFVRTINVEKQNIKKETLIKGKVSITYDTLVSGFNVLITQNLNRVDTLLYPPKSPFVKINMDKSREKKEASARNECLTFFSIASDGVTEFLNTQLKVEEFLSTSTKPILNYIFFDYNSSDIPSRYNKIAKGKKEQFNFDMLRNQNRMVTYYQILNIIGKRLEQNEKAKITLVGCNSGVMAEADNIKLSKDRAEEIKKYFVDVWDINHERINIKSNNLPDKPSNSNEYDGIEENRRVEILSDSWEIMAPIIVNDTLLEVTPSQIRFYNNANSCIKVDQWSLIAKQGDRELVKMYGSGNIPERLIWRINDTYQSIPKSDEKIFFKFELSDYDELKYERRLDSIEVEHISIQEKKLSPEGDRRIDKYGLILFDFDKATLNLQNDKIMDFINKNIFFNSKVTIKGHTDRIGEDEYNLNLSLKRASAVAGRIKNTQDIFFEGLGEKELLFNNDLPEGRFYSRTVNITVETPLE